jgi:hypothetical protein
MLMTQISWTCLKKLGATLEIACVLWPALSGINKIAISKINMLPAKQNKYER